MVLLNEIKLHMYMTLIVPILLFESDATLTRAELKHLQVFHMRCTYPRRAGSIKSRTLIMHALFGNVDHVILQAMYPSCSAAIS